VTVNLLPAKNFFTMIPIRYFTFKIQLLVLALNLAAIVAVSAADKSTIIYKYVDDNGVLHLTNKKPKKESDNVLYSRSYMVQTYTPPPPLALISLLAFPPPIAVAKERKIAPASLPNKVSKNLSKNEYSPWIQAAATRYRLPEALLHAVIQVESNYNPNAVSPKGATGLMQLMPGTGKQYGVTELTDPQSNIEGGAKYLRFLLDLFNQDLSLALAGYNAGENAVKRYNNTIPPYAETQDYVKKVTQLYQQNLASLPATSLYE
jgi:soluble lytic murein transglycosylase-like protein